MKGTLVGSMGFVLTIVAWSVIPASAQPSVQRSAQLAQQRVVKVYGAGGLAGLDAYQSGFLVSPDGHIATAWSSVLDVEPTVILDDGRRFDSTIVGFEPSLELAVLKINASELPFFGIQREMQVQWGDSVLAVSNLFGIASGNEPASVMQGNVAAITMLDARRGTFKTPYRGEVILLDLIANNPGAAGGALVNVNGELIGMLGKELRDAATGGWLNYALPASSLRQTIGDIIAGRNTQEGKLAEPTLPREKAHAFASLGLVMVPDVLESTPAYVDEVIVGSWAERANMRPDDLVLRINGQRVDGQRSLREILRTIDRRDPVEMTIQRGSEIILIVLKAN